MAASLQSNAECLCLQAQHTYPGSSSALSSCQVSLHAQLCTLRSVLHWALQSRSGLDLTLLS